MSSPGPVVPMSAPSASSASARVQAAFGTASKATGQFLAKPTTLGWLWYAGLPILAFVALVPGNVLTLPPVADENGNTKFFFSGQSSFLSWVIHSFIFLGVLIAIFKGGRALKLVQPF